LTRWIHISLFGRKESSGIIFSDTGIEEMSSLQSHLKQIPVNAGYYVPVGDCRGKFYLNTSGSDSAPIFNGNLMISTLSTSGAYVSTMIAGAGGGVFRDHGKTLVSSGRTFRKVQLLVSTGNTEGVGGLGDGLGLGGSSQKSGYLTGYIELPGLGGSSANGVYPTNFTPVARLG